MRNRTHEVSVLLAGERGFIFHNLRWQLQESETIHLIPSDSTSERDVSDKPDYIVYIFTDRASLNSGKYTCESEKTKIDEICRLAEQECIILVLGAGNLNFSPSGRGTILQVELPEVFGKWEKPGKDSPVALACNLILEARESEIVDSGSLELLYIDDLSRALLDYLCNRRQDALILGPLHNIAMEDLKSILLGFRQSREDLMIPAVGKGLVHAMYATYLSYMDKDSFTYPLKNHADNRGSFIEILKTEFNGQVSCLTAGPGVMRGQHYHHSKSEKFLVVQGTARFRFRNLLTQETHEVVVSGDTPQIVETIPGWVHNITNISDQEMIVILWANELFNPEFPDTIPGEI